MTKIRYIAICLIPLLGCKARSASQAKNVSTPDKQSLEDRLDQNEDGKELLSPGPRFSELEGDERYGQKLRINALLEATEWNSLQVLKKDSESAGSIQEYQVMMSFAGAPGAKVSGAKLHWTIPATSIFGAPTPVRNFLVQSASGFWNFSKQETVPIEGDAEGKTKSQLFKIVAPLQVLSLNVEKFGVANFLSVDLYHPLKKQSAENAAATDPGTMSIGLNPREGAIHSNKPLYFVKNLVGANAQSLSLNYGSIFLEVAESRAAGSGFGIWLGEPMTLKALKSRGISILVLGHLTDRDDENILRKFTDAHFNKIGATVVSSSVSPGRLMPAYDAKGLIVGSFDQDTGTAEPAAIRAFQALAKARPARAGDVAPLTEPVIKVPESSGGSDENSSKTWTFETYAHGSKWTFVTYYRKRQNSLDVDLTNVSVFRDGAVEVFTQNFTEKKDGSSQVQTKKAFWWNMVFKRQNVAPYLCSISYHVDGTPLIGWEENVQKEARCEAN